MTNKDKNKTPAVSTFEALKAGLQTCGGWWTAAWESAVAMPTGWSAVLHVLVFGGYLSLSLSLFTYSHSLLCYLGNIFSAWK